MLLATKLENLLIAGILACQSKYRMLDPYDDNCRLTSFPRSVDIWHPIIPHLIRPGYTHSFGDVMLLLNCALLRSPQASSRILHFRFAYSHQHSFMPSQFDRHYSSLCGVQPRVRALGTYCLADCVPFSLVASLLLICSFTLYAHLHSQALYIDGYDRLPPSMVFAPRTASLPPYFTYISKYPSILLFIIKL